MNQIIILTIKIILSSEGEQISNLRLQPQIEIGDEPEDHVVVEHRSFSSDVAINQSLLETNIHLTADTQPGRSMTCEIDMASVIILDVNHGSFKISEYIT